MSYIEEGQKQLFTVTSQKIPLVGTGLHGHRNSKSFKTSDYIDNKPFHFDSLVSRGRGSGLGSLAVGVGRIAMPFARKV